MKTIKEHQKVLIDYYKEIVKEYDNLFDLKCYMLKKGICPRCGTPSRSWSVGKGHFPCRECDFKITEWELNQTIDEYHGKDSRKKGYLRRRLKQKSSKGFVPFSQRRY